MIRERSPRTAAHFVHSEHIVPMTAELRPVLQALLDHAPAGSHTVVPRLRSNMRASCATDWAEAHAAPVRAIA